MQISYYDVAPVRAGIEQLLEAWRHPRFGQPIWDGQLRDRQPLPDLLRVSVLRRDRYRCAWCGGSGLMQVDHIVPVAAGGSDLSTNLQTLCERCNALKSNRLTIDAWSRSPWPIVIACHNEMSYDDEVIVDPTDWVFCAMCMARRKVEASHAVRYELTTYLRRKAR